MTELTKYIPQSLDLSSNDDLDSLMNLSLIDFKRDLVKESEATKRYLAKISNELIQIKSQHEIALENIRANTEIEISRSNALVSSAIAQNHPVAGLLHSVAINNYSGYTRRVEFTEKRGRWWNNYDYKAILEIK